MMTNPSEAIDSALAKFVNWLNRYGEASFDHQSFYAGPIGRRAKQLYYRKPRLGVLVVSPMVFFEAFWPTARKLFWNKMRLPIADAHYAMGFAFLFQETQRAEYYQRSVEFLDTLIRARSKKWKEYCWGYPFDWVTREGTIEKETPLITTTPYVYEAFEAVFSIDQDGRWLEVMRSIAEHGANDIEEFPILPDMVSSGYYPGDKIGGVVNASAYRAFLLTQASIQFKEKRYLERAEKFLNFVLNAQQPNGSWNYAASEPAQFVDHFHTCFVLKSLVKIEKATSHRGCQSAIKKGIRYYLANLFDEQALPKPFSAAPRLTIYRNELYDYAECINLGILLSGEFQELDRIVHNVIWDLLVRWQKKDGSFRSRKLHVGWDNVPMHRWGQSQIFRSLCLFLSNKISYNEHDESEG